VGLDEGAVWIAIHAVIYYMHGFGMKRSGGRRERGRTYSTYLIRSETKRGGVAAALPFWEDPMIPHTFVPCALVSTVNSCGSILELASAVDNDRSTNLSTSSSIPGTDSR
jgi:hypothetical protein